MGASGGRRVIVSSNASGGHSNGRNRCGPDCTNRLPFGCLRPGNASNRAIAQLLASWPQFPGVARRVSSAKPLPIRNYDCDCGVLASFWVREGNYWKTADQLQRARRTNWRAARIARMSSIFRGTPPQRANSSGRSFGALGAFDSGGVPA